MRPRCGRRCWLECHPRRGAATVNIYKRRVRLYTDVRDVLRPGTQGGDRVRKRRKAQANSTDVARVAGVSIAAVSRAFSPDGSISTVLREKVYAAARKLNYVPNTLARSLITRQTNIVALMLANMSNPIYAQILSEASRRLEDIGKQVLLFTPRDPDDFDRSLQHMLQYQVDAIVIAAASISSQMATLCLGRGVPVVTLGRHIPGLPVHSIRGNAREGGERAAEMLLSGHGQHFGMVTGPAHLTTMIERKEGALARLSKARVTVEACDGGLTYEGGRNAALQLMRNVPRPDSLICMTDIMALGAMDAVRHELGLKIPDDVAVIGFDDIPEAGHASYQLTTIKTPVVEMVDYMIDLVSDRATNAELAEIQIPAEVIVRGSTRAGDGAMGASVNSLGNRLKTPPKRVAKRRA
ncbi:MAG: LacI family DNA-binding transcriptional regulator [Pseudomonadota bacterium]